MLLRYRKKGIQCFAEGREPQPVIDEFGIAMRQDLRVVRRLAIQTKRLEFAVSQNEQRTAWCFVCAARFNANQAIFHQVDASYTICCGYSV